MVRNVLVLRSCFIPIIFPIHIYLNIFIHFVQLEIPFFTQIVLDQIPILTYRILKGSIFIYPSFKTI